MTTLKAITIGVFLIAASGCSTTYEFTPPSPEHPANPGAGKAAHERSVTLAEADPVDPRPARSQHWSADDRDEETDEPGEAEIFRAELTGLVEIYLQLKDALFESSLKQALHSAREAKEKLESIGLHRLGGADHMAWMETYRDLIEPLTSMTETDGLDELRAKFRTFSEEIIKAVTTFRIDGVVYHQYCPMEDAVWLSDEEEIRNPYAPETMPDCGEVIERIDPDASD